MSNPLILPDQLSCGMVMSGQDPDAIGDLAVRIERAGFDSIWVVEHTHIPASRRTPYPLGPELPSIYWEAYEPFTYLAQVAAVTENLKIGTGICLVPEHHHPRRSG